MSPFLSQKFRFHSFLAMVLLVFVHGYDLEIRYLQPWTVPGEALTFNTFVQYLLANGLLRFRIPMLFVISGYLFALGDAQPHRQRVRKRLRTLGLPYLLWSALGLAATYALELWPATRAAVAASRLAEFGPDRLLVHQYGPGELLVRWLLAPLPFQLWFLRVLLFYNLAYPGLRWCVERVPRLWFGFAVLAWLSTAGILVAEGPGLLFFTLGVWLQKSGSGLQAAPWWLRPRVSAPVFVGAAVLKTGLAFGGQALLGDAVFPVLTLLHKLTEVSGLAAVWFGADALVRAFMSRRRLAGLTSFSFVIYALHVPLLNYALEMLWPHVAQLPHHRLACFLILPTAVLFLCVATGAALRAAVPGLYGLLTGGRGMGPGGERPRLAAVPQPDPAGA